jgi:hypothetical protein
MPRREKAADFLILFVSCLFNDVVCSSVCIASDDRTINKWWIEKDTEGIDRDLI